MNVAKQPNVQLNKRQGLAVRSKSYPMYLHAGAGSGKTHVLVEKITDILTKNPEISLENFAIITFTNKATDEMSARLQTALHQHWLYSRGSDIAEKLHFQLAICNMTDISTIHGFCERLIRQYGALHGIPNTFSVGGLRQQTRDIVTRQVNRSMRDAALQGIPQYKIVDKIMELLDENSRKGQSIDEEYAKKFAFDTPQNEYYNSFKKSFLKIYCAAEREITELKANQNLIATDDLISVAVSMLDNPQILKRVTKQYRYLFVDEFQDTNYEQFLLVDKLIKAKVKVFVIGDKNQSIYAFRGADVKNSERMTHNLAENKRRRLMLDINYRTDPALLDTINTLFSSSFTADGLPISFDHFPLESGVVENACAEPFRIQFRTDVIPILCEIIDNVSIKDRKAGYSDIAILCRRNYDVERIGKQLKAKNIPVEIIGGKGFYSSTEIIDTYKMLNALLYKGPSAMYEIKNTFYYRALVLDDRKTGFGAFFGHLDSVCKSSSLDSILGELYKESRVLEYLRAKKQYQAIANLLKLKDKAKTLYQNDQYKPLQFLNYLGRMITSGKDEDEAEVSDADRQLGVVSLYSIHKAKGLEFPIVIVPNCDLQLNRKATMPALIFDNDPEEPRIAFHHSFLGKDSQIIDKDYGEILQGKLNQNYEEELRIFYVACTRAKNMLILSCRGAIENVRNGEPSWAKWVVESDVVNVTSSK